MPLSHFPRLTELSKSDINRKQRMRKRCRLCRKRSGIRKAVTYYCPACPGEPGLCLEPCFREWKHVF